jgi:TPR repeat protein
MTRIASVDLAQGNIPNSAFEAFSRGAAKSYVPAVYRLAVMYKDGFGTTNNIKQCRNLLNIAVSRGHLLAKQDLA